MAQSLGTLGSAYVQIVPSARGIGGSISKALSGEAALAGTSAGSTIASKIKGAITVAAIGKTLAASVMEGAALEQSLGGVETLYKKHASAVVKNADKAYKTAGLSANAYMETATSFAASLLQSVNGNTQQAAKLTDMAIIDMSDNANKMGTDMQRIQDAYQGFAKQNYTMLDNLKLGYGGTKTEMERLLADAEKITGIKYDISNLSDVYSAIHVIQGELGITGTTAKEAATTLAGSFSSMKAAAQNFMGDLALGRNVGPAMVAFAETTATFLFDNLMPAIGNIITSLPTAISALITTGLPQFMASGKQMIIGLANGIVEGGPKVLSDIQLILTNVLGTVTANLPSVLNKGIEVITNFASGILQNIPSLLASAGEIITQFLRFITQNLPVIMRKGGELIGKVAAGIVNNLPQIVAAMAKVIGKIIPALVNAIPTVLNAGKDLIGGLASGLAGSVLKKVETAMGKVKSAVITPIENAKEAIKIAIDKIKGFFNITLKFKGIKLPHISVAWKTGGAIAKIASKLGLPGVPDFNVSWYKTGGIFDSPSVIGVGEAGTEAVMPLDMLWGRLDRFINAAVNSNSKEQSGRLTEEEIRAIVSGCVAGLTTPMVEGIVKAVGNMGIKLDRRELGRVIREVM